MKKYFIIFITFFTLLMDWFGIIYSKGIVNIYAKMIHWKMIESELQLKIDELTNGVRL